MREEPMGTSVEHGDGHKSHPSVSFYVLIGVILSVVTGIEVAIYYMPAFETAATPLLVLLSAAKVVLVIMFFMHLKMDHRSLTWIFICGAALAAFMVSALVVLYHFLPQLQS